MPKAVCASLDILKERARERNFRGPKPNPTASIAHACTLHAHSFHADHSNDDDADAKRFNTEKNDRGFSQFFPAVRNMCSTESLRELEKGGGIFFWGRARHQEPRWTLYERGVPAKMDRLG